MRNQSGCGVGRQSGVFGALKPVGPGLLVALAGLALALPASGQAVGDSTGRAVQPKKPEFAPPLPNVTAAQGSKATGVDSERPSYPVSGFNLRYATEQPQLPGLDDLVKTEVVLGRVQGGYVAPGSGTQDVKITLEEIGLKPPERFSSKALFAVAQAVLQQMNRKGVVGVTVAPSESEFTPATEGDPEWGKDLRPANRRAVTLVVRTAVVTEIRTIAFGDRIKYEDRINSKVHERIRKNSPVVNFDPDDARRKDLLRKDLLDNYVFRLNRHPGRRVDLAIAAAEQPGAIALDYLVNENKPWLIYGQASNTGTASTGDWRGRFGFVNNQITNADDILSLDFVTAGSDSNAFVGSYDRPLWGDWLRGKVFGSWNKYTASDVGFANESFTGEGFTFGGELSANVFQYRELFIDVFSGVRFENVTVNNAAVGVSGDEDFFLPTFGARLERNSDTASTNVQLSFEFNAADVAGTSDDRLQNLGRLDPTKEWYVFQWDATHSFYLEPLLIPSRWNDTGPEGSPTLAHELALSFRGQYAFTNRLVPTAQQVVGGLFTVRGYPESVVAGDTVLIGSAEYRFHLPQALRFDPNPGQLFGAPFRWKPQQPYGRADWDLVLKGFIDAGRSINSDRQTFETDETLVGAGVGVEFAFKRNLTVRVDWGFALDEIDGRVDSGDNRVHFLATLVW